MILSSCGSKLRSKSRMLAPSRTGRGEQRGEGKITPYPYLPKPRPQLPTLLDAPLAGGADVLDTPVSRLNNPGKIIAVSCGSAPELSYQS